MIYLFYSGNVFYFVGGFQEVVKLIVGNGGVEIGGQIEIVVVQGEIGDSEYSCYQFCQ